MSGVLPVWLNEKVGFRWHEEGLWKEIEFGAALYGSDEAVWTASADDVPIEVRLDWEKGGETTNERKVACVTVTIGRDFPGASTPFSGAKVYFENESSLECVWKPHLAPSEGMVVGDKAFRSPAIVFENGTAMTALVPDLHSLASDRDVPNVMDYTVSDRELVYGLCEYEEVGHVYHRLTPRSKVLDRRLQFRFYLVEWEKKAGQRERDFRAVERFLWERFGREAMPVSDEDGGAKELSSLEPYANYAYGWALDRWKNVAWQQFRLEGGTEVGGVVFLVCARQKPGFGQEEEWREPKSLWNQAWFCGLRSAYGYALWGREKGRTDWEEKAELALNFALSAPQTDGLFPGYYQAGEDNRWESGRWYMSGPRRPAGHEEHIHLLDASWTCWWLLKWYRDIKRDERILPYVTRYAERLLALQREDGAFPAWVRLDGAGTSPFLTESPETSMHAMLFVLLHRLRPDDKYVAAAIRAATFVADRIVPEGRWEDFETYWSCSRQWEGKQFGEKDSRSGLYNQCNFGMYWSAEAFKDLYSVTGDPQWLEHGEQVLAEASLYQQIWQPDFFPVPTVGGFGVMTSDDEWNDARQSLFALTYWDYYRLTDNDSYRARAIWAMKASFYMMYCPENVAVRAMYESVHPHFDERDYGFHMENFNHHDGTPVDGLGEFTIFDWGCGAAAASLAEFKRKLG
ncbi:hypothetical protein [Cohnella cholangitidis]|uniref:Uncharacterized protein n=1 Tax=Cohnella cholangitidis TaxID=2598458 RepID=A0A7G5C1W3_9BACL|nr:hypothetical protein [Cohnella cholangitidis]QMV43197.1 hypothetical protein FPL14_19920 [Cohnella cholangitidis]